MRVLLFTAFLTSVAAFASTPTDKKTALIIVDTQQCFTNGPSPGVTDPYDVCPEENELLTDCQRIGSLGVATGQSIVPNINQIREDKGCLFDLILRSQDYHPAGHISFATTHFGADPFAVLPYVGYPINMHCTIAESGMIGDATCCLVDDEQDNCYVNGAKICTADTDSTNPACSACALDPSSCTPMPQAMWLDHCLQDGDSGFADGLLVPDTDIVLQKGTDMNIDAYSVFMDNARIHKTELDDILKAAGIERVMVVGIATDFCVSWTATDAASLGYETIVVYDASAPIVVPNPDGTTSIDVALAAWEEAGVQVLNTADILDFQCPARRRALTEQPRGRVVKLN